MITRDLLYAKRKDFPRLRPTPFDRQEADAIVVDEGDWKNVEICLLSEDGLDNHAALHFLVHISDRFPVDNLPFNLTGLLVQRIPHFMFTQDVSVRYVAQGFFVQLRMFYSDYRERMFELLYSNDIGDRFNALHNYSTFLEWGEIEPLIKFKDDDYASESKMMGPFEYEYRNFALAVIEKTLGRSFDKPLKQEPYDGSTVSWHDWSNFLEWWLKSKNHSKDIINGVR